MSDPRQQGIGRAGRGAMLLEALRNLPRRPGENRPTSGASGDGSQTDQQTGPGTSEDIQPPSIPRAMGRAALLQNLLSTAGRGAPSIPREPTSVPHEGRGRASLSSSGRGMTSSVAPVLGRGRAKVGHATPPSPISDPERQDNRPSPELGASSSGYESECLGRGIEQMQIGKYAGKSGKPLELQANYVRLKYVKNCAIHEYHVDFEPSVDSRNMRFKVMNQEEVKAVIGNVKSFDGAKLYLPVKLAREYIQTSLPTDKSPVTIRIRYIKESSGNELIHLFNLLFRRIMNVLKMVQVGRNYFDPRGGVSIPKHRLEIWPGYVTAVMEFEGGVMLCCDSSFRILRTITALEVMNEASAKRQNHSYRENIEEMLLGTIILTRYNNKTYRVDDINWNMNPMSTFTTRDGKEISFCDYYERCYDIKIQNMDQPLLINKPDKKINAESDKMLCLIPELCYMTGLTDDMRSDFMVMKDIASHTKISPAQRHTCLQRFIENINSIADAKKVLQDWNLEFESATVQLEGRLLEPEKIIAKNSSFASPTANWDREIGRNEVLVPVNFENWMIVFTKRDQKAVGDFINMLQNVCPNLGIRINPPTRCPIDNDRTDTYLRVLRERVDPRTQMVVIVFPNPRDDRYSAVKRLCCIDMPVPSQVINSRTISNFKRLRSVTIKIALQINCKLGGELWTLAVPLNNVMVCGMDAYHDKSKKGKSILGFVASLNHNLSRYYSLTASQLPGQELGDAIRMLFLGVLRKYHEVNHQLPSKIIIFRDGVSDGMIDFVADHEFSQLRACFPNMNPDYNPSLTVVVVQKRINTRIYNRMNGGLENPAPGSILDHTVTRKGFYDFFLVPQHVTQGTVTPTHYIVAKEMNSKLQPDHIQRLTYKMTHLYYNWPGTIRVPAPCMYAHKLAFLVGQNLSKEANVLLADKLFYL